MMRRRAMVGRPVARVGRAVVGTAVVAGTAGAVHHHQQKKYAQQDAAAQQQYDQAYQQGAADAQAQQYAPPPEQYAAPVEQAPAPDLTAQLQQLADLHTSGVLSDEEFATAKQKLLAG
jgi:Short C-terminal domain